MQGDDYLGLSTVLVVPTSRSAAATSFRPEVTVAGELTHALTEQMLAVDIRSVGELLDRLDFTEQRALDRALVRMLGLR